MLLVSSFGAFTLAFGWWISKQFSTRFLRNLIRVSTIAIVVMCIGIVWLSLECSGLEAFEIPISHAPLNDEDFWGSSHAKAKINPLRLPLSPLEVLPDNIPLKTIRSLPLLSSVAAEGTILIYGRGTNTTKRTGSRTTEGTTEAGRTEKAAVTSGA